ncbi:hypothetical protein [Bosea sp. (in: a-proteobacteria)]|uniref:hypothetical protein n=1 Tax=Bosea sp. (in: a-proteobacteria) TaxID=1871050 RepID=UPI0025C2E304|nr:hypothetical protein [Bosea sp. (in: a-proteobacteria)]
MMMRLSGLAGSLMAFAIAFTPAMAGEKISVSTSESNEDGAVMRSVNFSGACGEECFMASLRCGETGPLEVDLIDVASAVAAKSLSREQSVMILAVGGQKYEMPVASFTFSEMNGSWDVSAYGPDTDPVFKSFATAKDFTLSVEARREVLPVTREVKAWAKACLH